MKKTSYKPGQFCWVDLQTSDIGSAKEFYSKVMGWDFRDLPTELGPAYTMFMHKGLPTAGMARQPPSSLETGAPPVWSSYVCVQEMEATIARALELDAKLVMPTMAMKEGSFAMIEDPTGAVVGLWKAGEHIGAGWVNDPGGFCWNELYTSNIERSKRFYEQLWSWEFGCAEDGDREYWTIKNQGQPNGGMIKIRPEWGDVMPSWSVYFVVESCAKSVEQAEALGANVFLAPIEQPTVGTFAGLVDPQGAHFLVIELVAANKTP